jgi:hypothetical protein
MTTAMHYDSVEQLYRASTTPRLVRVPPLTFLCIDGRGGPNTGPTYADAVRALFSMSYAARSAIKRVSGQNVKVSPLEGLWWADDMDTRDPPSNDGTPTSATGVSSSKDITRSTTRSISAIRAARRRTSCARSSDNRVHQPSRPNEVSWLWPSSMPEHC